MANENIQGEEILVQAIDKTLGNRIHVRISEFKDRDYLDIRNYYEDENGEWKPTRKGIAIPVEFYDELVASIAAAKDIIETRKANKPASE